jgi:hypothetical protein
MLSTDELLGTEERPGCLILRISRQSRTHYRPGIDADRTPISPTDLP